MAVKDRRDDGISDSVDKERHTVFSLQGSNKLYPREKGAKKCLTKGGIGVHIEKKRKAGGAR